MQGTIPVEVSIDGTEMRLGVVLASASVHRMIGARAILGRTLEDADNQPGAPITAVLSEGFWRSQFGVDRNLLGRIFSAEFGSEERVIEIVGVVVDTGNARFDKTDVWLPSQLDPAGPHYNQHTLFVLAKRKPRCFRASGTDPDRWPDRPACDRVSRRLRDSRTGERQGRLHGTVRFPQSLDPTQELPGGGSVGAAVDRTGCHRAATVRAWVAIANLFLARVEAQRPEMAVRTALGAGRGAVVRQLAWTSTLIVVGAWLVGSGLAWLLAATWVAVEPIDLPRADDIGLERRRPGVSGCVGGARSCHPGCDRDVAVARRVAAPIGCWSWCDIQPESPAGTRFVDRHAGRVGVRAAGRRGLVAVEFPQSCSYRPRHRPGGAR